MGDLLQSTHTKEAGLHDCTSWVKAVELLLGGLEGHREHWLSLGKEGESDCCAVASVGGVVCLE
jgi:hypothetical protein